MWSGNDSSMQNEGGFMDTTANNTSMSGGKDTKRGQNCIPVMIAHLNRYGDHLEVWGVPARIVTFIGIVYNIDAVSTKVSFNFRDETGIIKGIKWLEGDNTSYEPPVTLNTYARVYGTMRNQNNENFVLIINIQPMENLNELLTHLMEVTLMSLEEEKTIGIVAKKDKSMVHSDTNDQQALDDSLIANTNRDQSFILNIIRQYDNEYGAERNEIMSKAPQFSASKVNEILEFLSSEGHVYTTKTDDYFKVI